MKYCSDFKAKEMLQYASTWRHLKNIILSEMSQMQKDDCYTM